MRLTIRRIAPTFALLALLFMACNLSNQGGSTQSGSASVMSKQLTPSAITVPPGSMATYGFSAAMSGRVQGRFEVSGGARNDIQVLLLNADQLTNYRNGNAAQTYYNSGKVTVGNIDVRVAAGEYYLVFDNSHSIVSNKAVTANITISPF